MFSSWILQTNVINVNQTSLYKLKILFTKDTHNRNQTSNPYSSYTAMLPKNSYHFFSFENAYDMKEYINKWRDKCMNKKK